MSNMIKFIQENWRLILEIALVIVSTVIFIVRKRPVRVVDTVKETICRLLPYCITLAEKAPKGEKLSQCLILLSQLLSDMGIELNDDYKAFALEQVEIILSTPQKKGINK